MASRVKHPLSGRLLGLVLRTAEHVPPGAWAPVVETYAWVDCWHPNRQLRQWQLNVETATGRRPGPAMTRAAIRSWARNLTGSLRVGTLTPELVDEMVVIDDADRARLEAAHAGPGAVVALPHMGSWDLGGAWVCMHGMPVSTVAEELVPDEFELFVEVRTRIGFTVYGHREDDLTDQLVRDLRDGKVVCLMADRDFSRHGIPSQWPTLNGSAEVSMPIGPATIARRTGATLLGASTHFEGKRLRIVISEPIPQGSVVAMTQGLCDWFAGQVAAHPQDWHMLQPVFRDILA